MAKQLLEYKEGITIYMAFTKAHKNKVYKIHLRKNNNLISILNCTQEQKDNFSLDIYKSLPEKYNDDIVVTEKKVDLDELYPFDKSGSARLGRCDSCNGIVFGNKFTIHKDDSDCCKAKINKYR